MSELSQPNMPLTPSIARAMRYILTAGIILLPIFVLLDYQHELYGPAAAKVLTLFMCGSGLWLARSPENIDLVKNITGIALLILASAAAMMRLDSYAGLVWVALLPTLFFYFLNIRNGIIFSAVYFILYCLSFFTFEWRLGVPTIDTNIWAQSTIAYITSFVLSLYFRIEYARYTDNLHSAANRDFLTDTLNRRGLCKGLHSEIKRANRYQTRLSVVLFDIDNFKLINDRYGHIAGDHLLAEFSTIIKQHIRASDMLARWGGEEFIIVSPQLELTDAKELAEKLRKVIAEHHFNIADETVTASFGVTCLMQDEAVEELIGRADDLLYKAKALGKNLVAAA